MSVKIMFWSYFIPLISSLPNYYSIEILHGVTAISLTFHPSHYTYFISVVHLVFPIRSSPSWTPYCLLIVPVKFRVTSSVYAAILPVARLYTSWCWNRCYRERKVRQTVIFSSSNPQKETNSMFPYWCSTSRATHPAEQSIVGIPLTNC